MCGEVEKVRSRQLTSARDDLSLACCAGIALNHSCSSPHIIYPHFTPTHLQT